MWPGGWAFHHCHDVLETHLRGRIECLVPKRLMNEDVTGLADCTHSPRVRFRRVVG